MTTSNLTLIPTKTAFVVWRIDGDQFMNTQIDYFGNDFTVQQFVEMSYNIEFPDEENEIIAGSSYDCIAIMIVPYLTPVEWVQN